MIIARAPFRISFVGGGSDLPIFYRRRYGAVVSATINKYMYVIVHPYFHKRILVKYARTEDVDDVQALQHPIVREALNMLAVKSGVEISSIADVPAGTGLGSSSAFAVALLRATYALKGESRSRRDLAEDACRIEIDILKEPIGKQDQYAASFGGLNYIRFNSDESVVVEPLRCEPVFKKALEERLLVFYLGTQRPSNPILTATNENMKQVGTYRATVEMVELAERLRELLLRGELRAVGELLHEGWNLKKNLAASVTNEAIDHWYGIARQAGAAGGKVLGAGGGGFLLVYCEPERQARVRSELAELQELPVAFEDSGCALFEL